MPTYDVGEGRAFSTINSALAAVPSDLSGGGIQHIRVFRNLPGSYDELVNTSSGFLNPSSSDFIRIEAMCNHNGLNGTGIINNYTGGGNNIVVFRLGAFSELIGFEVQFNGTGSGPVLVDLVGDNSRVNRCIFRNLNTASNSFLIPVIRINASNTLIHNNSIYDCHATGTGTVMVGIRFQSGSNARVFNNSVFGNTALSGSRAYNRAGGVGHVLENNYGQAGANSAFVGFSGNTMNNNASSDATADDAGGIGNLINVAVANQFVNISSGSEDSHLKAGADLIGAGKDLSSVFTTDLDNGVRPSVWDIGSDQFGVSGPPGVCTFGGPSFSRRRFAGVS